MKKKRAAQLQHEIAWTQRIAASARHSLGEGGFFGLRSLSVLLAEGALSDPWLLERKKSLDIFDAFLVKGFSSPEL